MEERDAFEARLRRRADELYHRDEGKRATREREAREKADRQRQAHD